MVDELMSAYGDNFLVAALGVALGILCLFIVLWLLRSRAPSPFVRGGRNRQPRLQILDAAAVDTRRRIVLIRRDTVEHLVMIGGPTDIVIETGIGEVRQPVVSAPHPPVQTETQPPAIATETDQAAPLAAPAVRPASPAAARTTAPSGPVPIAQVPSVQMPSVQVPSVQVPNAPAPAAPQPLRAAAPALAAAVPPVAPVAQTAPPAPAPSPERYADTPSRPEGMAARTPLRADVLPAENPRPVSAAAPAAPPMPAVQEWSARPAPASIAQASVAQAPVAQAPVAPAPVEPASPPPVGAPTIAAERRPDRPMPAATGQTARSEPALFAAATVASTVAAPSISLSDNDSDLRTTRDEALVDTRDALLEDSKISSATGPAVLFDEADRLDVGSTEGPKRAEPVMPSYSSPSFGEEIVRDIRPAESIAASPEPILPVARYESLDLAELVPAPSLNETADDRPPTNKISELDQIFALQPDDRSQTTDRDIEIDAPLTEPSIAESVMELQPELAEIDDIYVPDERPPARAESDAPDDEQAEPDQHKEEAVARQDGKADIPNVEDVLEAARHKVLVDDARPEPRPFPQERFERDPAPVQFEQAEAPKRDMSEFERVLEQEMAMHLAASPIPPKRTAAEDGQQAAAQSPLPDGPRLPADVLLSEGLVARRSDNQAEGAKADGDPNLQNEIARIFGEMSASRNS